MCLQAGFWKLERSHEVHVPVMQGINPVSSVLVLHPLVLCSLMASPEALSAISLLL